MRDKKKQKKNEMRIGKMLNREDRKLLKREKNWQNKNNKNTRDLRKPQRDLRKNNKGL